jgi:hypothetical protein
MNYTHILRDAASEVRGPEARRVGRQYLRQEEESEGLHWAVRASFLALVSPRAWLEALFPRDAERKH